jgi:hypothetical protein
MDTLRTAIFFEVRYGKTKAGHFPARKFEASIYIANFVSSLRWRCHQKVLIADTKLCITCDAARNDSDSLCAHQHRVVPFCDTVKQTMFSLWVGPPRKTHAPGVSIKIECSRQESLTAIGHLAAARVSCDRSGPVLINPLSSSSIQPLSQAVFGAAPVM